MSEWSISKLLSGLHDDISRRLATIRETLAHPGTKGDASETVWLELLQNYLPKRYQVEKAHIVDSKGAFSQQIDVVIFDRQYSPFIFNYEGSLVIPAESVYAVFEAKQTINAPLVMYASEKVASVRRLYRTSLPIPYAGGTYPPKSLPHVLGGLLCFESEWNPPLGGPLLEALQRVEVKERLDLGCVAAHGTFGCDESGCFVLKPQGKPASAFLFELIARLQDRATVPMIDIRAYAEWLDR
jgi:hypothetical protein